MLTWFSCGNLGQLFIAGIVKRSVQCQVFGQLPPRRRPMKNIQPTILTAPDLCKNVPLAVLFDSNGNSYVVPTKSDMRVCISYI